MDEDETNDDAPIMDDFGNEISLPASKRDFQ